MRRKRIYKTDEEKMEPIVRLIEGIILGVFDKATISGKWYNRKHLSNLAIFKKIVDIYSMKIWFKSVNCATWMSIYGTETKRDATQVKRGLERIANQSLLYIYSRSEYKQIRNKARFLIRAKQTALKYEQYNFHRQPRKKRT